MPADKHFECFQADSMLSPVSALTGQLAQLLSQQSASRVDAQPAATAAPPANETQSPVTPSVGQIPLPRGLDPRPIQVSPPVLDVPASPFGSGVHLLEPTAFGQLRSEAALQSSSHDLSLELRTQEGDVVRLDFSQFDYAASARDAHSVFAENGTERALSYSVSGDLSDAELAALDRAIGSVVDVASRFFNGDLSDPAGLLAALDFDGEQLAALSLNLEQTQTFAVRQEFGADPGTLKQLGERNSGVQQLLSSLGEAQRQFLENLQSVLDAPSAGLLNQSLFPQLLEPASDVLA